MSIKSNSKTFNKYNIWEFFTDQERKEIENSYENILKTGKYSRKDVMTLTKYKLRGRPDETYKDSLYEIQKDINNHVEPFIHNDSLTDWCNNATLQYGLKVKDILKLKKGDKLDLLLFDRNLGDYAYDLEKGAKYEPLKNGLNYAIYIHRFDLTGILYITQSEVVLEEFEWELNLASIGEKGCFWGPYIYCDDIIMKWMKKTRAECDKEENEKMKKYCMEIALTKQPTCPNMTKEEINKLNPNLLVGFRGPCILRSNGLKMPKYVKQYKTWWDDFVPWVYHDFLNQIL